MAADRLSEWDQVKREFDRYEFTWPHFKIVLLQPFEKGWEPIAELAGIRISI